MGTYTLILTLLVMVFILSCIYEDVAQLLFGIILILGIISTAIIMTEYDGEETRMIFGEISSVQQNVQDYIVTINDCEFTTTNTSLKIGDIVKVEYKRKDFSEYKCDGVSNIILLEEKEKK